MEIAFGEATIRVDYGGPVVRAQAMAEEISSRRHVQHMAHGDGLAPQPGIATNNGRMKHRAPLRIDHNESTAY